MVSLAKEQIRKQGDFYMIEEGQIVKFITTQRNDPYSVVEGVYVGEVLWGDPTKEVCDMVHCIVLYEYGVPMRAYNGRTCTIVSIVGDASAYDKNGKIGTLSIGYFHGDYQLDSSLVTGQPYGVVTNVTAYHWEGQGFIKKEKIDIKQESRDASIVLIIFFVFIFAILIAGVAF